MNTENRPRSSLKKFFSCQTKELPLNFGLELKKLCDELYSQLQVVLVLRVAGLAVVVA